MSIEIVKIQVVVVKEKQVDLISTGATKTDLGLGSVDNTRDADKPVSTPQAAALALKADINFSIAMAVAL